MILSDVDIRKYIREGSLVIEPLHDDTIRENGVDLRIGGMIGRLRGVEVFDPKIDNIDEYILIEEADSFIIYPNEYVLIHTLEYIKMPSDIIGFINLRSSYARLGLHIPPTIIDANFEGELTIGLSGGGFPVKLYKGERIIHVVFSRLSTPTSRPYKGKYRGQRGIQKPIF